MGESFLFSPSCFVDKGVWLLCGFGDTAKLNKIPTLASLKLIISQWMFFQSDFVFVSAEQSWNDTGTSLDSYMKQS